MEFTFHVREDTENYKNNKWGVGESHDFKCLEETKKVDEIENAEGKSALQMWHLTWDLNEWEAGMLWWKACWAEQRAFTTNLRQK